MRSHWPCVCLSVRRSERNCRTVPPTASATAAAGAGAEARGEAGGGVGVGEGEGEGGEDKGDLLHGGDIAFTARSIAGHVRYTRLDNHGAFVDSFIAVASSAKANAEINPLCESLREGCLRVPFFQ